MQTKLLGAVDTVTSVAQAGDDVAVLVQVVVLGAQNTRLNTKLE